MPANAHPAVVVGNGFQQEIDRVVGVAGFVNLVLAPSCWECRAGRARIAPSDLPLPAHVAIGEDVAVAGEELRRAERSSDSCPRRKAPPCRACASSRWGSVFGVVFRRVDGDKQTHAIAHGRQVFGLRVIRLNILPEFLSLTARSSSGAHLWAAAGMPDKMNNTIA